MPLFVLIIAGRSAGVIAGAARRGSDSALAPAARRHEATHGRQGAIDRPSRRNTGRLGWHQARLPVPSQAGFYGAAGRDKQRGRW